MSSASEQNGSEDAVTRAGFIAYYGVRHVTRPRFMSATPPILATVTPPDGLSGPPLIADWWLCPGEIPENGTHGRGFEPVILARIGTSCADPVEWRGVIGWLNHLVARIDYPERPAKPR